MNQFQGDSATHTFTLNLQIEFLNHLKESQWMRCFELLWIKRFDGVFFYVAAIFSQNGQYYSTYCVSLLNKNYNLFRYVYMECKIYSSCGWLFTLVRSFLYNPLPFPQATSFYYCIYFLYSQCTCLAWNIANWHMCSIFLKLFIAVSPLLLCLFILCNFFFAIYLFLSCFVLCKSTSDLMSYHDIKN